MRGTSLVLPAIAAGVVAAVAWTLSPVTVLVALAAVPVLRVGGHGLEGDERRWFWRIVGVALTLRMIAVVALFVMSPHDAQSSGYFFGDEAYALERSWRIRNIVLGIPVLKHDWLIAIESYGDSSFVWTMAFLQTVFGPAPYALRLLNALLFTIAVLLLYRVARRAFGRLPALAGLAVLMFLPTLFFWSISLLKESFYFCLTVLVVVAAAEALRGGRAPRRLGMAIVCAAAIYALGDLRGGAVPIAIVSLALGATLWYATASRRRFMGALAVGVVAVATAASLAPVRAELLKAIDSAATTHSGHVFTVGHSYHLLDESYYLVPTPNPTYDLTAAEATRYVLRALGSYLVVPWPWQLESRSELAYVPEQIFWYALLALAPAGVLYGWRCDRLLTMLLVGYLLPTAAAVALTSGNVGTLVRHRTLIAPFLIWLSAAGGSAVLQSMAAVRSGTGLRVFRNSEVLR